MPNFQGKGLYQYGRYKVFITPDHVDEETKIPREGYAVVNTETAVTEATSSRLYRAMNLAQIFENSIKQVLALEDSQEEDSSWAALIDADTPAN